MKNIIPITDLQRRAGQVVSSLSESGDPVVITRRGRPAAVLVSAVRYARIEADLYRLDEFELLEMVKAARVAQDAANILSHAEVKPRLGFVEDRAGNEN